MNATNQLHVQWERDRLFVPVPWDREEELRIHLRSHGIESTAHLNPAEKEARLEVHTADVEAVQAILDQWEK
jgi:hypothetical protein